MKGAPPGQMRCRRCRGAQCRPLSAAAVRAVPPSQSRAAPLPPAGVLPTASSSPSTWAEAQQFRQNLCRFLPLVQASVLCRLYMYTYYKCLVNNAARSRFLCVPSGYCMETGALQLHGTLCWACSQFGMLGCSGRVLSAHAYTLTACRWLAYIYRVPCPGGEQSSTHLGRTMGGVQGNK